MDKYNTKMTINKWFSYINLESLSPSSQKAIQVFNRYAKKLTFSKALMLFLFAINEETESLRHLDQQLVHPQLKKVIGVDRISYSQLSRALKAVDTTVLLDIFNQLLGLVHPEQFEISNASEHDHDYLDVFVNQPLATYVFDRGYIDFKTFDQMKWEGYFFVSRIKKNTVVHVVEDLEVPKDKDSDVLSDINMCCLVETGI